jgi:hypothetical protein
MMGADPLVAAAASPMSPAACTAGSFGDGAATGGDALMSMIPGTSKNRLSTSRLRMLKSRPNLKKMAPARRNEN